MNRNLLTIVPLAMILISGCSAPQPQTPTQPTNQPPVTQQPNTSMNTTTPTPAPNTTQVPPATNLTNGKDIYDKQCAKCHGVAGKGGNSPRLNTAEWNDPGKVENIVRKGRQGMPAFQGKLGDDEIKTVSQYVASLSTSSK